ncbi:hypothetical protein PGB90_006839 [Kerria lacca]
MLFNKTPLIQFYEKIYNDLSPYKFGGYFKFLSPVLVLRDPEIIKNICTKDFSYFTDHFNDDADENEPFEHHLFKLRGQKWKILRNELSQTFTARKIKLMFNLLKNHTRDLLEVIDKMSENGQLIEMREIMTRYTMDIITSCIFGFESNSLKDPNSLFRTMAEKAISPQRFIINSIDQVFPKLRKLLRLSLSEKKLTGFFTSIVSNNIKYREENNVSRDDFIDLLMVLKKKKFLNYKTKDNVEKKIEFTDELLTAQCLFFYLAGIETSAGTLTFALYELAKHEDIQRKLFNEVEKITNEDEELSYESLQKMTYLEQIINETLRMYPIVPFLNRVCNRDYLLEDNVLIEKGTRIIVPVAGLHHDPQYYENPTEFNPENFSKEAKEQRHRYVYLPFGEGPRMCLGMRMAFTQVKLGLAAIIRNYKVFLSSKRNGPFKFRKFALLTQKEGGVWLTFSKRM